MVIPLKSVLEFRLDSSSLLPTAEGEDWAGMSVRMEPGCESTSRSHDVERLVGEGGVHVCSASPCETGVTENVDVHPPFRSLLKHKAFLSQWVADYMHDARQTMSFLAEDISQDMHSIFTSV